MATTFSRISDVTVKLAVSSPTAVTGLGNVMIIAAQAQATTAAQATTTGGNATTAAQATTGGATGGATVDDGVIASITDSASGAVFKTYPTLDVLAKDFTPDTNVYKKAKTYFDQENPSDRISVLTYQTGKATDALGAFWNADWTFAILADNNDTNLLQIANVFEANEDHMLVIQVEAASGLATYGAMNYTIGCVHKNDEAMDAALLGRCASLTVGSITWKFKDLKDITPQDVTAGEKAAIDSAHGIAYITVHGKSQTSEGFVLAGEYIDEIHGEIWVKNNMESTLENLLQVNGKVPYDAAGIAMVQGAVTSVLQKATDQGIVLTDKDGKGQFSVTAADRSAQSSADLSARKYAGCSFTYQPSSAIHTITVNGTVDSSTILG